MSSQGFPLWAVEHPSHEVPEPDGTVYVVVGWDEGYRTPRLVALGTDWRHTWTPSDGQVFTFTTTDPTEQPDAVADPAGYVTVSRIYGMTPQEIADELAKADDLRQRFTSLAGDLEGLSVPQMASVIRAELDK